MATNRRQTRRDLLGGGAALAALAAGGSVARAQGAGELVIGVPMPLTGVLAQAGQLILTGIRTAADEANKAGGVAGRQVRLVVEDTKSEPNTAATVATKMATQDKVWAFCGGYGSTADFAMLQSIKRYEPIYVHAGSSSVKLEQAFGPEPWYFHVYIWDYHRQKVASRFIKSIGAKKVALAYEDGLYGSDAARYSTKYMAAAGLDLAMKEPFKAGSPDFSPILNRVKSLEPDVFYVVGYSGDNVQIARQARSLNIRPKLMLTVAAGDKRGDYGDFGVGNCVIGEWSAEENTPGNKAWVAKVLTELPPGTVLTPSFTQGYTAMKTLLDAVRAAGSTDRAAVLKALAETTFDTPYGKMQYRPSEEGGLHQLLTDETMIVSQFRAQGEDVVWPDAAATGKLVYPVI